MGLNSLDRLVREYGGWDGPFLYLDFPVRYKYDKYDPRYDYPPDLARALAAEQAFLEEAAEQEAAKKTPPSTHSGE